MKRISASVQRKRCKENQNERQNGFGQHVHETVLCLCPCAGNCLPTYNRLESEAMDEIFRKLIDSDFSDLAGLTVDASIPVPEWVANEVIESTLQGNKNIRECHVSIHDRNKVSVNLKTPLWLWSINLKLQLEGAVDFTGSPKFRVWLENHVLLGKLGSLFKALPAGVSVQSNQVIVDIQSILKTPEQRKMLALYKSVLVRTEPGKVILDIKISVD
jgi:hypothetical protein